MFDDKDSYFRIAQIQFERGITATPLEFVPFPDEVARCQRYFEKSYSPDTPLNTATDTGKLYQRSTAYGHMMCHVYYRQSKRITPDVEFWQNNRTPTTPLNLGRNHINILVTGGSSISSVFTTHWSADAEIY